MSEALRPDKEVEVVVAGHICLDVIPTLLGNEALFMPGHTIEAGRAVLSTGGAVSNTGLALHKLGVATRLMGKVGTDLFGQAICQIVDSYGPGLSEGTIVVPGEASSYSVILSAPGTDRILIHAPGCNDTFGAEDIHYASLAGIQLFHFGYPPLMRRMYLANGAELSAIFQQVRGLGITTSLDLSMPDPASIAGRSDWQAILAVTLPSVDIFLPSAVELLLMLRRPLFDELLSVAGNTGIVEHIPVAMISELGQSLIEMGVKIAVLKIGSRGLYVRTANTASLEQIGSAQPASILSWADRELWAPCYQANVVGTTGSGDATIAGFLMGLLHGMNVEETISAACAVGACSVEAADALSAVRSWSETSARLKAGWARLHAPLLPTGEAGWLWNKEQGLWLGPADRFR